MAVISKFRNKELYFHHSFDETPDTEKFVMHAHDVFEILYVISGSGSFSAEGTFYDIKPGGLYITRPAEAHYIVIDSDQPYERMAIHFSPDTLLPFDKTGELLRAFNERERGRYNCFEDSSDMEFCKKCFDRIDEGTSFGRERIIAYLLPILNEIRNFFDATRKVEDTPQTAASELVDYINRHLFEDLSLDKISKHFFISKSQVNRSFRKATGSSVWEYVVIKRLLSARNFIREGVPINEAFSSSGFKDYSTFWRAYKNHFGCSPKDDVEKLL